MVAVFGIILIEFLIDFEKHLRESSNSDMQQGKNGDGVSGQGK